MDELTFAARAANGNILRGIVTLPEQAGERRRGLLILGAGVNPRYAWHRFSVKMARLAAKRGFHALRMDPQGVGDSDGVIEDIDPTALEAFHEAVQTGLFVNDCRAGLTQFIAEYSLDEVAVAGLCGGALTGLFLAASEPRISTLAFIAGPVHLSLLDAALPFQPAFERSETALYLGKLSDPRAWWRLLSGQSDYRRIFFLMKIWIYRFFGREHKLLDSVKTIRTAVAIDEYKQADMWAMSDNSRHLNPYVPQAFIAFMERGGDVLFINAEMDQATWGFRNYFAPTYLDGSRNYRGTYDVVEIKKANHIFSSQEAQEQVMALFDNWLINACKSRRCAC